MIVDFKPQAVMVPTAAPDDVQLWPNFQNPEPAPLPRPPTHSRPPPLVPVTGVDDRRFGTYGGLASSRSKAVDASIAPIQSLASW